MRQALVDPVNRVTPIVGVIPEEAVARDLLLVLDVLLHAVRQEHVVDPLERIPRDPRSFLNEPEIVLEGSFPIQFLVLMCALQIRHRAENMYGFCLIMHSVHLFPSFKRRAHRPDCFGSPLRGLFTTRPVPPRCSSRATVRISTK